MSDPGTARSLRRIDMHMHAFPQVYVDALHQAFGAASGLAPPPWSVEEQLGVMDRYDTDLALVSLAPPGVAFADPGPRRELARQVNEDFAALVAAHPGRFAALAALPLPDTAAAIDEISYALDTLALDGIGLMSNVAGTYLGAEEFIPVFDELDRRGAFVFVHPAPPSVWTLNRFPIWLLELPFDTTRTIVDLIYSGTFERCPHIRFLFPHCGGTAPFLAHRLATLGAREPALEPPVFQGAAHYLSRLFYDTAQSDNLPALRPTWEVAGEASIVYGSDWPYAIMGPERDPQPGLAVLNAQQRAAIDVTNALALMPELQRHLATDAS